MDNVSLNLDPAVTGSEPSENINRQGNYDPDCDELTCKELVLDSKGVLLSILGGDHVPSRKIIPFQPWHRFPQEIRNMVWSWVAHEHRVVEIAQVRVRNKKTRQSESRFKSFTVAPAMLHTNREARREGLMAYSKLSFGSKFSRTYINWDNDFIIFNTVNCGDRLDSSPFVMFLSEDDSITEELLQKCRRLAVWKHTIDECACFKNLECLVEVNRSQYDDELPCRWDRELRRLTFHVTSADLDLEDPEDPGLSEIWSKLDGEFVERLGDLSFLAKGFSELKFVGVVEAYRGGPERWSRKDFIKHRKQKENVRLVEAQRLTRHSEAKVESEKKALFTDSVDLKVPVKVSFDSYTKPQLQRSALLRGLDQAGGIRCLRERLVQAENIRYDEAVRFYTMFTKRTWRLNHG